MAADANRLPLQVTRRTKRVLIAVLGLGVSLGFISLLALQHFALCRSKLVNVFFSNWREYRYYHDGHYPSNIVAVSAARGVFTVTNSESLLPLLSCPGAGTHLTLDATNDSLRSDYIYVNWEPYFGAEDPPMGYPIFYDRRLSNHLGLGVNVMTRGRLFWDFRARWLKRFSAEHPEYHIQLPE